MQSDMPIRIHPATLWRNPEFHPDRLVPGTDSTAYRDRSYRYRLCEANHVQRHYNPGLPDPQQYHHRGTAFRRFDRFGRLDQHPDGAGHQWLSGADESPGAWGPLPFARLSTRRDGALDRRDSLHCARGRPEPDRAARPEFPGRQRSADLVPGPRQPDLFHLAVAPADAWLCRQDRIHHPVGLACFAKCFPSLRKTAPMAALPDARPLSKAQGLRLSLAAAAAAALAGCGGG